MQFRIFLKGTNRVVAVELDKHFSTCGDEAVRSWNRRLGNNVNVVDVTGGYFRLQCTNRKEFTDV